MERATREVHYFDALAQWKAAPTVEPWPDPPEPEYVPIASREVRNEPSFLLAAGVYGGVLIGCLLGFIARHL